MKGDIVEQLRVWATWLDEPPDTEVRNDLRKAANEIERLREKHRAACKDRDAYRSRYHRWLAASVWKPGTRWTTYVNPQSSHGLFVATMGGLRRPEQAAPTGCLRLQCQLPHDDAEAVVRILNEWTECDVLRSENPLG